MWRTAVLMMFVVPTCACGIIGPSCQGETGFVYSLSGEVPPDSIVVHEVQYGTEGSQNDGRFTWTDEHLSNGPRLQLFVTRIECDDFDPRNAPLPAVGVCAPMDASGWQDEHKDTTFTITHGQGNPATLGPTAQYKIWIVGDAQRAVRYTVTANWNRPVDC
jgi:hypothetical protein